MYNEFKCSYGWAYFDYEWPRYGSNSIFEDGNSYSVVNQPEVAAANYTDGDLALLKAYNVETFSSCSHSRKSVHGILPGALRRNKALLNRFSIKNPRTCKRNIIRKWCCSLQVGI